MAVIERLRRDDNINSSVEVKLSDSGWKKGLVNLSSKSF